MDILDILLDILLKPPQPFIGLFFRSCNGLVPGSCTGVIPGGRAGIVGDN